MNKFLKFIILLTLSNNIIYCMQNNNHKYGDLGVIHEELIQYIATSVDTIIYQQNDIRSVIKSISKYLTSLKSLNSNFYNLINQDFILKIIGNKIKTKFNVNEYSNYISLLS